MVNDNVTILYEIRIESNNFDVDSVIRIGFDKQVSVNF